MIFQDISRRVWGCGNKKAGRICPVFFYFLMAQNSDHSQPMPDHPNIQLPRRMWPMATLSFFAWRASHAGAHIITSVIMIPAIYLPIKMAFANVTVICFICIPIRGDGRPVYADYIPYFADFPSSSSMRINWLYFAMRSVRDIDPVFIWPAFVATARSAIVVSSVSPLRCEMMTP